MKYDNKAWLFLVPALGVMAVSAFIPLDDGYELFAALYFFRCDT